MKHQDINLTVDSSRVRPEWTDAFTPTEHGQLETTVVGQKWPVWKTRPYEPGQTPSGFFQILVEPLISPEIWRFVYDDTDVGIEELEAMAADADAPLRIVHTDKYRDGRLRLIFRRGDELVYVEAAPFWQPPEGYLRPWQYEQFGIERPIH